VRSRLLEPGDMATPQRPVFALALTQPKWVRVYVGEPDLGRVRPGMPARVDHGWLPRPVHRGQGRLHLLGGRVHAQVGPDRGALRTSLLYELRVLVDDPQDVLRLGQPATVHLTTGTAQ
jgi:HlyD family secretion protein